MAFIETTKDFGLDPKACLFDSFARINDHTINRNGDFLPWNGRPMG